MKMMKESMNPKKHSDVAVEISGHGTLEDKLWQTVAEAAIPFEIGPRCARSLRAWNAIGVERMKLEGRVSPEDLAIAKSNLKRFLQLMKIEGVFIGHADRLDNVCFNAAHLRVKRRAVLSQFTLWPFWPNDLVSNN